MIINRTIKRYPEARRNDPCAVCGQSVLGQPIVWHGYGWDGALNRNYRDSGRATHEGCYWDETQKGPGPYLTYGQLRSLNNAVRGRQMPDDLNVSRFLSAVSLALQEWAWRDKPGDGVVAIRLGPDLVTGYGMVLARVSYPDHKLWQLKDANGTTDWIDPQSMIASRRTTGPFASSVERSRQLVRDHQARLIAQRPRLLAFARNLMEAQQQGNQGAADKLRSLEHTLRLAGAEVRWNDELKRAEWQTYQGSWMPIPSGQVQAAQ